MQALSAVLYVLLLTSCLVLGVDSLSCPEFPWNSTTASTALSSSCGDNAADKISACSLMRNGCDDAAANACNSTRLIATLCVDQPQLSTCTRLINEYPAASAAACLQQLALPLPRSSALTQDAQQLCSADSALPGCSLCSGSDCANPLVALMMSCPSSNNSPACTNLAKFCVDITPAALPAVCQRPAEVAASKPKCVTQSSRAECSSYRYPDDLLTQDLQALCRDMPDMPTCTLFNLCQRGAASGPRCNKMQLLATGCAEMPGMADCDNYNNLCGTGSVVEQCKQDTAIAQLPNTSQTRSSIISSCSSHFMPSCKTCTNELRTDACPDPFTSLSKVCQEHPSMEACQLLYNFCTGYSRTTFHTLCPAKGSSEALPSMMQYLHQRIDEVVLFRSWVTRSKGAYAGTIIVIVLFGIVSQFLKTVRSVLDAKWMVKSWTKNASDREEPRHSSSASWVSICFISLFYGKQLKRNVVRTLLTAVILTLDYWNMLICMTFNVGMFVAVILGYSIGTFLFSHVVEVLRIHSKQAIEPSFYENGAAASLLTSNITTTNPEVQLVKEQSIKSLPVEACGCDGLTSTQIQQVVQMNLANRCEGCA